MPEKPPTHSRQKGERCNRQGRAFYKDLRLESLERPFGLEPKQQTDTDDMHSSWSPQDPTPPRPPHSPKNPGVRPCQATGQPTPAHGHTANTRGTPRGRGGQGEGSEEGAHYHSTTTNMHKIHSCKHRPILSGLKSASLPCCVFVDNVNSR